MTTVSSSLIERGADTLVCNERSLQPRVEGKKTAG